MEWIDQLQDYLGAPVVAFAQQNWIIIVAVLAVAGWWFFFDPAWRRDVAIEDGLVIGNPDDADGDGGGDGGD